MEPLLARGAEGVAELLKLTVGFELNWTKEAGDPREKCEIPDIRLWFLRLDAEFPWLPVALDWRAGELARYTAMLVPHQVMTLVISLLPLTALATLPAAVGVEWVLLVCSSMREGGSLLV